MTTFVHDVLRLTAVHRDLGEPQSTLLEHARVWHVGYSLRAGGVVICKGSSIKLTAVNGKHKREKGKICNDLMFSFRLG